VVDTLQRDEFVNEPRQHRRRRETQSDRLPRTYQFEIIGLIVVALGIFLIFERLSIRSSLIAWLRRMAAVTLHGVGHLDQVAAAFLARTTLSDVIGYALVLGALAAILLRVRWRLIHNPALALLRCPKCSGRIHRVHRDAVDRLISFYVPVRRYRCANAQCGWHGLRVGAGHGPVSRAPVRKLS
jgi:hypothetical protein